MFFLRFLFFMFKNISEEVFKAIVAHKNKAIILFAVLVFLDIYVWFGIANAAKFSENLELYFLNVGQGDSELAILPGGVKILIDGGPANRKLINELSKILPPTDRYLDIVMISHPQLDHFGGIIDVLENYKVGIFLFNGVEGTAEAFKNLKDNLKENNIRQVVLRKNDKISYRESKLNIIWPEARYLKSKELNDTTLVMELVSNNAKIVFTGDISAKIEEKILRFYNSSIDILKVPHHGSKFSTGEKFLAALQPKLAFIEVGRNSYGHPTQIVLDRLRKYGVKIYRADKHGTTKVVVDGKSMRVFK